MTSFLKLSCAACAMAALGFAGVSIAAAEELRVNADQSQVLSMPRPPSTIVVGNPSIADVTVQGKQVFVHGRVFGKTNIIILDDSGNQMADYNINVVTEDAYNVVIYKPLPLPGAMIRESYTCKTDCELVLHIGDDEGTTKRVIEQQKNKLATAQGQKAGESGDSTPSTPSE